MTQVALLAQEKFQELVSKAVSRSGTHAVLSEPQTQDVAFTVLEKFEMNVTKTEASYATVLAHGGRDQAVTKNAAGYEALIMEEMDSLKTDVQVFEACEAKLQVSGYLEHAPDGNILQVYGHRRRIMHHYGCGRCGQTGVIDCTNNCDYLGKVNCYGCWGKGKNTCSICHGNGQVQRQSTHYVNGVAHTQTHYETCGHCTYGHVPCHACFQTGKITCGTCGGSRTLDCGPCAASGWLTDVATVSLEARYDLNRYVLPDETLDADLDSFIDMVGYDGVAVHASASDVKVVSDHRAMTVQIQRGFVAPRIVYTAQVNSEHAQIRHFGNAATIIDAGGILDHVLAGSLDTFGEEIGQLTGTVMFPKVESLVASLTKFLRSGLAREVVAAAYPGDPDADAIHAALHRSASVENIAVMMAAVRKALGKMRFHYLAVSCGSAWVLSPVATFVLIYLGLTSGWAGIFWGIGVAAFGVAVAGLTLRKRVKDVIPAADAANRDEYGESAIGTNGNPLLSFAGSAGLLFKKTHVAVILGIAALLAYQSGSVAVGKHAQRQAAKRLEEARKGFQKN